MDELCTRGGDAVWHVMLLNRMSYEKITFPLFPRSAIMTHDIYNSMGDYYTRSTYVMLLSVWSACMPAALT